MLQCNYTKIGAELQFQVGVILNSPSVPDIITIPARSYLVLDVFCNTGVGVVLNPDSGVTYST